MLIRPTAPSGKRSVMIRGRLELEEPIIITDDMPVGRANAVIFDDPAGYSRTRVYISPRDIRVVRALPITKGQILVRRIRADLETFLSKSTARRAVTDNELFKKPSPESIQRIIRILTKPSRDPTVRFMRLVYHSLHGGLNRTLEWVRDEFGQYWLLPLEPYVDSIEDIGQIGRFLDKLNAQWSFDDRTWKPYRFPMVRSMDPLRKTGTPISADDWRGLRDHAANGRTGLTSHLVTRALNLNERRDYRASLITMVTAVDREVSSFVARAFHERGIRLTDEEFSSLSRDLGLSYLVKSVLPSLAGEGQSIHWLSAVRDAINTRNLLVHGHQRDVDETSTHRHLEACLAVLQHLGAGLRHEPCWPEHFA